MIVTPIAMPNMQASKIASATWPAKNGAPVIKIAVKMAMLTKNKIKPKVTLLIMFNPYCHC